MATMNSSILHTSRSFHSQISSATSHPLPPLNSLCLNPCSFIPPRLSIKFSGFQSVYSKTNTKRNHFIIYSVKKLSDVELVQIPEKTDQSSGKFPSGSGVYAVYDKNEELQFIGISRSISASILNHQKSLPDLCYAAKVGIVDEPDRATLTEAWKSWMEEHIGETGKIPPGNQSDNQTWVRRTQKKPDLRLTPGRHVQLTVPLEDLIDLLVKENKVVAFIKGSRSAPQCGFSQKVVGILENEGVDFECVNVLDEEYNYGLRETLKRYSSWPTFPQIFVKGELIGGCDILSSMAENGELLKVFKD